MATATVSVSTDVIPSADDKKLAALAEDIRKTNRHAGAAFIDLCNKVKAAHDVLAKTGKEGKFTGWIAGECGISKSTAYRYIMVANVFGRQKQLSDRLSPQAAIELAKPDVPPAVRKKALAAAGKEDNPVEAEFARQFIRAEASANNQPPASDKKKKATPAELAVENAPLIGKVVNTINEAARILKGLPAVPGTEAVIDRRDEIMRDLYAIKAKVGTAIPAAVCPKCKGKKCAQCGNAGWVNSALLKEMS